MDGSFKNPEQLGEVIAGIHDVFYGLCRLLQLIGVKHDCLVEMMDAFIADAERMAGGATKRTLIPESLKSRLLLWEDQPPEMREQLTLIIGGKNPPQGGGKTDPK